MNIQDELKQKGFRSELEKMVVNILFTSNWLNLKYNQTLKLYDISLQQFNVLRILRGQKENPATINMITERMLDKSSNASRLVDKLLTKGFVTRSECPSDRRACSVFITEKGQELLKELDKQILYLEQTLSPLQEDEMKMVNDILDKFRNEKANNNS